MLNPYIESKYCSDGMFTSTAPVILMRFIVLLSNGRRQAQNVFCISALLFFSTNSVNMLFYYVQLHHNYIMFTPLNKW